MSRDSKFVKILIWSVLAIMVVTSFAAIIYNII